MDPRQKLRKLAATLLLPFFLLFTGASPASAQPGTFTTLHSFGPGEGAAPVSALVQGRDGSFYGTTSGSEGWDTNGNYIRDYGTVFQMSPAGSITTLHQFNYSDGKSPLMSPLVQAADGSFLGTTSSGGAYDSGTVFKINPSGEFICLHSFDRAEGGGQPLSGLIQASDGMFYGTASIGGIRNGGIAYSISSSGDFSVLHSFITSDGADPIGGLIQARDGYLYGTTGIGGTRWAIDGSSTGTVFRMTTAGVVTTLHSFNKYGADGQYPYATLIQAADGSLYGTAQSGGQYNNGVIFRITPAGVFTVVHSFTGSEGGYPTAGVTQASDGNMYGVTSSGGASNSGALFQMTPSGAVTVLHAFSGSVGYAWGSPVIQATDGNLYGVSSFGGSFGQGLAFTVAVATDSTAPTTSAGQAGSMGRNSWYTGPVQVTLAATDPDGSLDVAGTYYTVDGGARQTYTAGAPFTVSGDGAHTILFWSVDKAGNKEPAKSSTIRIDATPPSITATRTPPNSAGWNNTDVTVSFTGNDGGSGVDTLTGPVTITGEGTDQSVTGTVTDKAGNSASITISGINIDKTPPTIQTVDVNATATSVSGAFVTFPAPSASDNLSGVVGAVDYSAVSGSSFPVGTSTVVCTVSDAAGNLGTASFHVNVTYLWSGVLPPINPDGSSVFKQGSTIPVKFRLTGASAGITDLVANLSYELIGTTDGAVNEAISTSAADMGNQFRYADGQYIFNMATKGMTAGARYRLIIDLHDGVSRSVIIGLK
jgi:uncharacterized repeat protein (TIGR03803 family)